MIKRHRTVSGDVGLFSEWTAATGPLAAWKGFTHRLHGPDELVLLNMLCLPARARSLALPV